MGFLLVNLRFFTCDSFFVSFFLWAMADPTRGMSLLYFWRRKLIPKLQPLLNLAANLLLRWSNLPLSLVPMRFPWPLIVPLIVLLWLRRGALLRLRRDALFLTIFSFLLLLVILWRQTSLKQSFAVIASLLATGAPTATGQSAIARAGGSGILPRRVLLLVILKRDRIPAYLRER